MLSKQRLRINIQENLKKADSEKQAIPCAEAAAEAYSEHMCKLIARPCLKNTVSWSK